MNDGSASVVVVALPLDQRQRRRVEGLLSTRLQVPIRWVGMWLNTLPVIVPLRLSETNAEHLASQLRDLGSVVERSSAGPQRSCEQHSHLSAGGECHHCAKALCALCGAQHRKWTCQTCAIRSRRIHYFFLIRISVLLTILLFVVLYAWRDIRARGMRNDWSRTLQISLVVLKADNVSDVAIVALRQQVPVLEERLAKEYYRHHATGHRPFQFRILGPLDVTAVPPQDPGTGLASLAKFNFDLWRYLGRVNSSVGLESSDYDAVVYIVARPPKEKNTASVEGVSQRGGWLGVVEVELAPEMADYALFVAAHELFHVLGAEDKYDATGQPLVPLGLAQPDRDPIYPQVQAEVMARLVPLAPGKGRAPESLDELHVGIQTAQEIGWANKEPH